MSYSLDVIINPGLTAPATLKASAFVPIPQSPQTVPPQAPVDTAFGTSSFSTANLLFAEAALPTSNAFTILVIDQASGGDVFRSGPIPGIAGPSNNLVVTPPPKLLKGMLFAGPGGISATITATLPAPVVISPWLGTLASTLTGGYATPVAMTLTGVVIAAASPTPVTIPVPPGTPPLAPPLIATLTGTLLVRHWLGLGKTVPYAFTIAVPFAVAPSADSSNPTRIVALTAALPTFTVLGLTLPAAVTAPLGGLAVAALLPLAESSLNGFITAFVLSNLAGSGLVLTPTAVISMLTLTITASGIRPFGVIADMFGLGLVPPLKNFSVLFTPQPTLDQVETYTCTVTDRASGKPVKEATVTLWNYGGTPPHTFNTVKDTGTDGKAIFENVRFLNGIVISRSSEVLGKYPPALNVAFTGFNDYTETLYLL